jgi:hypothetical protein
VYISTICQLKRPLTIYLHQLTFPESIGISSDFSNEIFGDIIDDDVMNISLDNIKDKREKE